LIQKPQQVIQSIKRLGL